MKKLLILFLFGMFATTTQAQTFAEWFRQKKTQKAVPDSTNCGLADVYRLCAKGLFHRKRGIEYYWQFQNGESLTCIPIILIP